ncbi:VWA domain-containing protein [Rhizocola hellebori]|nr:VWA domain-containing protein [Rhizocola hellebori]
MMVVIAGGIIVVYQLAGKPSCTGQATLRVAATPEMVPALRLAGDSISGRGEAVNGACAVIEVSAADPADIAAVLAAKESATLTGVGLPAGNIAIPDVWVPDSSTWLARLAGVSPNLSFPEAPSLARSPVVVAMPEPVAAKVGWPTAKLTWQALLTKMTTDTTMKIGTVEPSRDAAGLAGLLALGAAMTASPDGQAAATGALRSLAAGRSTLRQDLLARFPRSADPAAVASGLSAAALTEQAVVAYNAAKPPIKLAALYLEPAPLAMDYPYAVMPGIDAGRAGIASRLLQAARTESFQRQLGADGMRGPDGRPAQGFALPASAPEPAVTPAPTATERAAAAAAVQKTLATWHAVTLPARMLAIIDVSGSMLERVPTAGNLTRGQVTAEAARRGLGLFDDSWAVGLWVFSTNMVGPVDHQELLPIQPLSVQRTQMLATLGAIQPKPKGDTGLYDTILAAYQAVQKDWDPGRVNSIVLMTDGDNDDDNGVSLTQLQDKLKTLADPKRPIQLIILGIGASVNAEPLTSITKITGGGVFVAKDPANIGEIFLKAISLRSGQAS